MQNRKVRVAFIDEPAQGLGWHGGGVTVDPGAYVVADLDGMERGIVMLREPGKETFQAMVEETSVAEFREVTDGAYAAEWAAYYRANPDVLASWADQNGRKP